MAVYALGDAMPTFAEGVWVAPTASVVGRASLGAHSSVWFGAVIRADLLSITIGECSNVQDNAVIHITGSQRLDAVDSLGFAVGTAIGDHVTIGHSALVHGCTIGDRVLVGMGAIVLDGAVVGNDVLIGAGALIPPKMRVPQGVLVVGSPAKIVRELRESERAWLLATSNHYVAYAQRHRSEMRELRQV